MSFDDRLTPMERRYDKLLDEFRELKKENQQQIDEFLADIDAYLDSEHTDPCDLDSKYWKARREKWEKKRDSKSS
jgi:hypothetical protein